MSKANSEVKLALTEEGFSDDLRTVIRCMEEKNPDRLAIVDRLWGFYQECNKKSIGLRIAFFSREEAKRTHSVISQGLQNRTGPKEIIAVLSMGLLVVNHDYEMAKPFEDKMAEPSDDKTAKPLDDKKLQWPLVAAMFAYPNDKDVLHRGLLLASDLASWYKASRTMLIDQKIVYLLEITLRNAKDMDIILAAIDVCACMSIMVEFENRTHLEKSTISELLGKIASRFKDNPTKLRLIDYIQHWLEINPYHYHPAAGKN